MKRALLLLAIGWASLAVADERVLNILEFGGHGEVDRSGQQDAAAALSAAVEAANEYTAKGEPACVYLPPGRYRITNAPPAFAKAGCLRGDGPAVSVLQLDASFRGDLFTWSEAWVPTTPGPTVTGIGIHGDRTGGQQQNALVFYDRNDMVFLDQIEVDDLPGRALYSGATRLVPKGYLRESHLRSLRFFRDGLPGVPVVEFTSTGSAPTDASNEIRVSQLDIYGAKGPSLVIRNQGGGVVRSLTFEALRIEGSEDGSSAGDLLQIGDATASGSVAGISFSGLELIDPSAGYAALRITTAPGVPAPYFIEVQGNIGGGVPRGEGLVIEAGRNSRFTFSDIHTFGTNVRIGPHVGQVVLDGAGREGCWSYVIDPTSTSGLISPAWVAGPPNLPGSLRAASQICHP